jgi:hypothetical protein
MHRVLDCGSCTIAKTPDHEIGNPVFVSLNATLRGLFPEIGVAEKLRPEIYVLTIPRREAQTYQIELTLIYNPWSSFYNPKMLFLNIG